MLFDSFSYRRLRALGSDDVMVLLSVSLLRVKLRSKFRWHHWGTPPRKLLCMCLNFKVELAIQFQNDCVFVIKFSEMRITQNWIASHVLIISRVCSKIPSHSNFSSNVEFPIKLSNNNFVHVTCDKYFKPCAIIVT